MGDRFQRMRLPALPTVLFADPSEDYRAMARDALLEGRNATDLRTASDGPDVLAYLERTETDVDHGSPYEAHLRKADGTELEVLVNKDFEVTAVNTMQHP